jgi:hypothetical protein
MAAAINKNANKRRDKDKIRETEMNSATKALTCPLHFPRSANLFIKDFTSRSSSSYARKDKSFSS